MRIGQLCSLVAVGIAIVLLWKAGIAVLHIHDFILPQPEAVAAQYAQKIADGTLMGHSIPTIIEAVLGFLCGGVLGVVAAYALCKIELLKELLMPYVVAFNSVPVVCIAPLVTIWFGFGIESKIVLCSIVAFFPVFVNTVAGARGIDCQRKKLFLLLGANWWQRFSKLELQSMLPSIFAGMRIAIVFSVLGAIISEFVGSTEGLGYLILYYSTMMQTATVFAAIVQLVIVSLVLHGIVEALEKKLVYWN